MKEFFKKLYKKWLVIADKIAYVQTRIILFVLYFVGVGIYGIIAFIFRVDLLDKRIKDAETFYKTKETPENSIERFERQF